MPLLNVEQAAERLGTSTRFIRRLIAERRIPFTKLGKHVRIDAADLDAFIAAGRVEANHWGARNALLPSPRSTFQQGMRQGR
jgi:excisionase family DNA binding protein